MSENNGYDFISDASMRNLIKNLNDAGLKTIFCCSGISTDHIIGDKILWYSNGSITFETNFSPYDKRNELIYYMAKAFNLKYTRTYNIRDDKKICLTELTVNSNLKSAYFKAKYDPELETNYIDDPNFNTYADVMDQLAKSKWEMIDKAACIIKQKGLSNVNAREICSICEKNPISATARALYLKKIFSNDMKTHYKKQHILHVIDKNNPIKTYNVKLKKSKRKIDEPKLICEIDGQNEMLKLMNKIQLYKGRYDDRKNLDNAQPTLIFEV